MEKLLSKSVITSISGIGVKYAKRLNAVGIKKPRDLLKQYEKLDKDPHRFVHWLKKECQAHTGHAKKAFEVVNSFNAKEKRAPDGKAVEQNEIHNLSSDVQKKYSINTAKELLQSSNVHRPKPSKMVIQTNSLLPSNVVDKSAAVPSKSDKGESDVPVKDVAVENNQSVSSASQEEGGKDALNQHLLKLREEFSTMHGSANQKMLELQSELGKMQHMSHEFDVLAEFLTSEEKLSIFEQNLDRLQKTVQLTEEKIHEINTNNQKMGRMIRQITETTRKQHENNNNAIIAIGDRLARWEMKLDRVARKIANHKIDVEEFKTNNDYEPLKNDIELMLKERLTELSTDLENMKNVIFCIISLIVLKMFVFDLFKDEITAKNA